MSCEEFTEYRCFLEKITSNTEECFFLRFGSYLLDETEIMGEIINWSLQFLIDGGCPVPLRAPIIRYIVEDIQHEYRKSPTFCGFDKDKKKYDQLKLKLAFMTILKNLKQRLLDNIELNKILPSSKLEEEERLPISVAASVKNKRRTMEDRYISVDDFNTTYNVKDAPKSSFYGVFDGHNGHNASFYSASQLPVFLAKDPLICNKPGEALRNAFLKTDEAFLQKCKQQNLNGGTTAVCALHIPDESHLYIAWVGDSKALLVKKNKFLQIVKPHKPNCPEEEERIKSQGGALISLYGVLRVNGILDLTRAIGDISCKPYVISDPDIVCAELDKDEDFCILASDGLWDFVSDEDIAQLVYQEIKKDKENLEEIPTRLIELAKSQGSTDNITIIVIFLKQPRLILEESTSSCGVTINTSIVRNSSGAGVSSTPGLKRAEIEKEAEEITLTENTSSKRSIMDHAFDNYKIEDPNNPSHDLLTNANSDLDFKIGKSPDIINSTSPFNDNLNNFMQNNTLSTTAAESATDKNADANNTEKSPFIDSTTSLNPFGEHNNKEERNNSTDNVADAHDGGYHFEKMKNDNQNAFLDEEDHSDQVDLLLQQQNEKNQQPASSPFECDMGPETSVDISDDVVMASEHADVDLISKYSSDCTGNNTEDTSPVMNPVSSTEDGIGMDFLKSSMNTNIGNEFDSDMNPFADTSSNVQQQPTIAGTDEMLEELSSPIKEDNSPSIENLQQTATDPLISPQNDGPSQLLEDHSFDPFKLNDFTPEKGEMEFEEHNIDVLREMGKDDEKDLCDDDGKYEEDEKDIEKYDHQQKEDENYLNMRGMEVHYPQTESLVMMDNKEFETECPKEVGDNDQNEEQLCQLDSSDENNVPELEEIVDSSLENELMPHKEEKADFKSDQEQLTSGVIPESCDESEDEWRYMQLKEGEAEKKFVEQQQQVEVKKAEAEQDEEEHSQNNLENTEEKHQEATTINAEQTNLIALSSALAVDDEQEKTDLDIEKPTSNPIEENLLKETSFSSSISNDPQLLEEEEEKKILNFGIEEEEDENNMMSQLNPDAKEFIPTSPSPVHFPLSPLASNQIPPSSFGSRGQIVDDIVSQSPRKPTISMDEIQIPDETQFNTEISQCPSELLNFKESMHGSEKEISSPDLINNFSGYAEQDSKENLIPQQSTDFANAEMGQSIYIENSYTEVEDLQIEQQHQEQQEPPQLTLMNDVTDILNSVQALPDNEEVIAVDMNEEIPKDISNVVENIKIPTEEIAGIEMSSGESATRPIEMDIQSENKLPENLPSDVLNGVQPKIQSPQRQNGVDVVTELIQDLVVNDEKGPVMSPVNVIDKNDLSPVLNDGEHKTKEEKQPEPTPEEKEVPEKEIPKVDTGKVNAALPAALPAALVEPEKKEVNKKEEPKTLLKTPKTTKTVDSLKKTPSSTKKTLSSPSTTKSPREPAVTKTSIGVAQKSKPPATTTTTAARPRTVPASTKSVIEKKTTAAPANVRSKIDTKPPSNLVKKATTTGSTAASKPEDQKPTKPTTSRTGLTARTPATTALKSTTTAKPKPASATSTGNASATTKTVSQRLASATGKPSTANTSSTSKTLSSPRSNVTATARKTEIKVSSSSLKTTTTKTTTTSSNMATKATKSQPVVSSKSSTSTTIAAKKTTPLASPRAPINKKTSSSPIKKPQLLKSPDKAIKDKISAGDAKSEEVVASTAVSTNEKIQIDSEVKLNGVTTAPEGTSNI